MLYHNIPKFFKVYIIGYRGVPFFYVADRDKLVHFVRNTILQVDYIYDMDLQAFIKCRYKPEDVQAKLNKLKAKELRFVQADKIQELFDIELYDPECYEEQIKHWLDNNATCFTVGGEPSNIVFEED